jgi:hypothetical protein
VAVFGIFRVFGPGPVWQSVFRLSGIFDRDLAFGVLEYLASLFGYLVAYFGSVYLAPLFGYWWRILARCICATIGYLVEYFGSYYFGAFAATIWIFGVFWPPLFP